MRMQLPAEPQEEHENINKNHLEETKAILDEDDIDVDEYTEQFWNDIQSFISEVSQKQEIL